MPRRARVHYRRRGEARAWEARAPRAPAGEGGPVGPAKGQTGSPRRPVVVEVAVTVDGGGARRRSWRAAARDILPYRLLRRGIGTEAHRGGESTADGLAGRVGESSISANWPRAGLARAQVRLRTNKHIS